MARGINKTIHLGRLGSDPDVNTNPFGGTVTRISLATSEMWKDKNTGEDRERVEWHRIVFFGNLAEVAAQYLKKGSQVYIEGSLRTNKWTDKNGIERYSTDINASKLEILTWPEKPTEAPPQHQQQGGANNQIEQRLNNGNIDF